MRYNWLIIVLLLLMGCNSPQSHKAKKQQTNISKAKDSSVLYTCAMHPQIRVHHPGKCPICGMTLIPVENHPTMKDMDKAVKLHITKRQQFLANIHTDSIKTPLISSKLELTGTTAFNPQNRKVISAWVSGWIEKMYVRNPGEKISKGQRLYAIYSPDLRATEQDYILAVKQKSLFNATEEDFQKTLQALRQKLLRWGLSQNQIEKLSQTSASGNITIYSKTSGFLLQQMANEGAHVNEGEPLLYLAENQTIWVKAQLYDNELPLLSNVEEVLVKVEGFNGKLLKGTIVFDNPTNVQGSRVHLVNIVIDNPDGKIQPGMLANVYLETKEAKTIPVIPKTAIVYDTKDNYVWIALPDNNFERRTVHLGAEDNTLVQVLKGVVPDESVVSTGVYLLNSEYELKYGAGVNLSGMQMSDMQMSGKAK